MEKILNLYKEIGETPLERLDRFRIEKPEYAKEKMSYVGRLDPMAEGVLLVVVGEENKNREEYLNMDKEYEFEALLGIKSDTYDILGLAEFIKNNEISEIVVMEQLLKFIGKRKQKYPAFSSKTINGISLFQITKLGGTEERPEREIEIYKTEILEFKKTKLKDLEKEILNKINLVKGDFRQAETIEKWKEIFVLHGGKEFLTFKAKIECSSGTYIRGIVNEIGEDFGCGAITLNIKRTSVNKFKIDDSERFIPLEATVTYR